MLQYTWRVTLDVVAPDCYLRPAILVNGQLGPTLELEQGEAVEVREQRKGDLGSRG